MYTYIIPRVIDRFSVECDCSVVTASPLVRLASTRASFLSAQIIQANAKASAPVSGVARRHERAMPRGGARQSWNGSLCVIALAANVPSERDTLSAAACNPFSQAPTS